MPSPKFTQSRMYLSLENLEFNVPPSRPREQFSHIIHSQSLLDHLMWYIAECVNKDKLVDTRIAGATVHNQVFGESILKPRMFDESMNDGILGLGFSNNAAGEEPSVFDNMISQGLWPAPVFSLYLNRYDSDDPDSVLTLGGTNPDYYTGDFTFANLSMPDRWQFKMDRVQFSNGVHIAYRYGCQAVIDTTSSFIVGPSHDVDVLNKMLGAIPVEGEPKWNDFKSCMNGELWMTGAPLESRSPDSTTSYFFVFVFILFPQIKSQNFTISHVANLERSTSRDGCVSESNLAVVRDNDECSDCEILPEFGGSDGKETVKDLKLDFELSRELGKFVGSFSSIFLAFDNTGEASCQVEVFNICASMPVSIILCYRQSLGDKFEETEKLGSSEKAILPLHSQSWWTT
ncbi:cathepsin d [Plakobranchus ocellatus]|uniref:Cathepsin d n=1 Tax=Plakobranchus ocellatus TaxID=259542 RepID=A0AAV3YP63_9GAST|nr:cathepsin d [Plakobranchus ocellatus]